ncbi:hypothetical protein [Methylocucumis oryzae]|nr:hypothetical protein [Methylocucumis oryzae]
MEQDALAEIQGEGVFYLTKSHYSEEFGLSVDVVEKQEFYSL